MDFTVAKEVEYVPDVYGNLELPNEEQVVITIKYPNTQETNMLYKVQAGGGSDTSTMALGVARLVKAIRNLKVNGKEIKTGQDLINAPGMYILVQTVGAHILGMISDLEADPT